MVTKGPAINAYTMSTEEVTFEDGNVYVTALVVLEDGNAVGIESASFSTDCTEGVFEVAGSALSTYVIQGLYEAAQNQYDRYMEGDEA